MAKRSEIQVFNLSFLDVLSCGLGAVVLISVIFSVLVNEEQKARERNFLIVRFEVIMVDKTGKESPVSEDLKGDIQNLVIDAKVRDPYRFVYFSRTESAPPGVSYYKWFGIEDRLMKMLVLVQGLHPGEWEITAFLRNRTWKVKQEYKQLRLKVTVYTSKGMQVLPLQKLTNEQGGFLLGEGSLILSPYKIIIQDTFTSK